MDDGRVESLLLLSESHSRDVAAPIWEEGGRNGSVL
jgi:hypothetical protein